MKRYAALFIVLAPLLSQAMYNKKLAVVFAFNGKYSDKYHDIKIDKQIKKMIQNDRAEELSLWLETVQTKFHVSGTWATRMLWHAIFFDAGKCISVLIQKRANPLAVNNGNTAFVFADHLKRHNAIKVLNDWAQSVRKVEYTDYFLKTT